MTLLNLVEALLVASEEGLTASDLIRLIQSRVAELEAQAEEEKESSESNEPEADITAELAHYAQFQELTEEQIIAAIEELNQSYEEAGRAFTLLERGKGWKVYTKPEFGGLVKHLFPLRKPKKLSGPALETLAIVAYRQPVTKAAIDAVRGVASDGMLQKLLDHELVKIEGRAELPGRPLLYATTENFLEHFGIRSPSELPNAAELQRVSLPVPEDELEEPQEEQAEQLTLGAPPEDAPEGLAEPPETPAEEESTENSSEVEEPVH